MTNPKEFLSKNISQEFPKTKFLPKNSQNFFLSFPTKSWDFENLQFPISHLEAEKWRFWPPWLYLWSYQVNWVWNFQTPNSLSSFTSIISTLRGQHIYKFSNCLFWFLNCQICDWLRTAIPVISCPSFFVCFSCVFVKIKNKSKQVS